MRCPLVGHDDWLVWQERENRETKVMERKVRNGTVWHGSPAVRFHVSPTFVLEDPIDNFIAGKSLIQEALEGKWGKAETYRLGYENSEDALTWNVFRSLQEAGELPLAVRTLTGIEPSKDPELYLWGRHIDLERTGKWKDLAEARNAIEPRAGQQTEPDCCIHLPGQAWLFIEAKFGSPTATKATDAARAAWIDYYETTCPGVFDRAAILRTPAKRFPEQLLRNVALALNVRDPGEKVIVVALVRDADKTSADVCARECLDWQTDADVRQATWESLYAALPARPALDLLKRYFEDKSYQLRPAFSLQN